MYFKFILYAILLFSINAIAQQPSVNPACTTPLGENETVLVNTVKHANHIRSIFCDKDKVSNLTKKDIDLITAPVFEVAAIELRNNNNLTKVDITQLTKQRLIRTISHMGKSSLAHPDLSISPLNNEFILSFIEDGNRKEFSIAKLQDCLIECRKKIKAYVQYINQMFSPLDGLILLATQKEIDVLSQAWKSYFEDAREQTFIDIAVNSIFYEWELGNKIDLVLNGPPTTQWFALHPSVIIENVPDAIDGQQTSEAIALEIIGFNKWQGESGCFGVPCGASAFVSYNDRTGISDTGWGIMFHIDNKYSFGVSKYGSDTAFFITVDLLKLFNDKKSSFEQWKKSKN